MPGRSRFATRRSRRQEPMLPAPTAREFWPPPCRRRSSNRARDGSLPVVLRSPEDAPRSSTIADLDLVDDLLQGASLWSSVRPHRLGRVGGLQRVASCTTRKGEHCPPACGSPLTAGVSSGESWSSRDGRAGEARPWGDVRHRRGRNLAHRDSSRAIQRLLCLNRDGVRGWRPNSGTP
jgi:hypothetical protein